MKSKFHKEVEVKAKLDNFGQVFGKLKKYHCKFSKPIVQIDTNFINDKNTFPNITPGCEVIRIREQSGKIILTYKQAVSNELDRIERELEIKDRKSMEDIIKFLGFFEIITVKKTRIETKYKDIEICLDDVSGLGKFIEVEKMTNEDDGEKVQEELLRFLESLGVSGKNRVFQGYDTLLFQAERKN